MVQKTKSRRAKQLHHAAPFRASLAYRVGSGLNWFGNDRFWTLLPADVTWGRGEKDILVSTRVGVLRPAAMG